MLAKEQVAVVEGYGVNLDCEVVWAWGRGWDGGERESMGEWLVVG
jgi:hypothetical protein